MIYFPTTAIVIFEIKNRKINALVTYILEEFQFRWLGNSVTEKENVAQFLWCSTFEPEAKLRRNRLDTAYALEGAIAQIDRR